MATADPAEGACPPTAVMTKYAQCLSLDRPESYSSVGRAADASVHVTKFPQPMIYSPTAGLVIYEPRVTMGVAQMQWLDKLSSPRAHPAKSPKVARQPPQQQHWRPPSPTNSRDSQHQQQQLQQQQQQQQTEASGGGSASSMLPHSRQRPPQTSMSAMSAQQQALQHERHWGSQMLDSQLHSRIASSRLISQQTGRDNSRAPDRSPMAPGTHLAEPPETRERNQHRGIAHHRDHQHSPAQQRLRHAPQQQGAVVSDRVTLTQPYVFRWGGRINSKHRPLCEMHREASPKHAPQGSSSTHRRPSCSMTLQQQRQHQHIVVDEGTAAAAVELGSRADKLMKLLELRVPQQHNRMRKKRPVSGRMRRLQQQDGDSLQADNLEYELGDEPIGVPQEYLRL